MTETQANAILDMKLSRLSKLDGVELAAERENLQKQKKVLIELISTPAKRELQMRQELLSISNKYGDAPELHSQRLAKAQSKIVKSKN